MKNHFLTIIFLFLTNSLFAISTAERVGEILQTHGCVQSGCHGGTNYTGLNLDGSPLDVYNALVNVTPANTTAAAKGHKLIKPGYPYQSFLLTKLNNGLIHAQDGGELSDGEGELMPPTDSGETPLTNTELELIRQWIYAGAPTTGTVIDESMLEEYYTDGGINPVARPDAPDPSEGFQIHMGPIFIKEFKEAEYMLKYDLNLPGPIEINRLDVLMNEYSHHFILYKLDRGVAGNYDEGLRTLGLFSNPFVDNSEELVAVWQYDDDMQLPEGTAFFWDENTVLDLNYHIPNYSGSGVLPADMYLNVYTQEAGTAEKEMKSDLLINFNLNLPAGETTTITDEIYNNGDWNIWMMTSHTHQYGTDFDVYLKNENGGKGEQVYEGFYNYDQEFDQGYYDWSHQPIRYFEPYLHLPQGAGLIQEAEYTNTSNSTVGVGLLSTDEMMITVVQYVEGPPEVEETIVTIENLAVAYCESEELSALILTPSGGILTGNGVDVDGQFNPSLAGAGTHLLSYTYEGKTVDLEVLVNALPDAPALSQVNDILWALGTYSSYQWYFNGGLIAGARDSFYVAPQSGTYSIVVTQEDGCSIESEILVTGINLKVKLKAFLEGALTPDGPQINLEHQFYLPKNQPYNRMPWNYEGTEVLEEIPNDMLDWVLVEVMDENETSLAIQAAILHLDGSIQSVDGRQSLTFSDLNVNTPYYFIVRHRNHIDIVNDQPLLGNNSTVYDYTDPTMVSGGTGQLKQIGEHYGMVVGDTNSEGGITVADYNIYLSQSSQIGEYLESDCNFDSRVTVSDFNLLQPNTSRIGVGMVRY